MGTTQPLSRYRYLTRDYSTMLYPANYTINI